MLTDWWLPLFHTLVMPCEDGLPLVSPSGLGVALRSCPALLKQPTAWRRGRGVAVELG
jgi:hypothetical protein